jgi:pimeloyl-ACP methyl ester carboxylesterase
MKRIFAIPLALALAFGPLGLPTFAAPADDTPIIMIAGYTAVALFENPASEDRRMVWLPDFDQVGAELLKEIPSILLGGLERLVLRRDSVLRKSLGGAGERILDIYALGADGAPKHDVGPYPGGAAQCSLAAIRKDRPEIGQLGTFCRRFEQQVGAERIFVFQYDWRYTSVRTAEKLREFIQDVKAVTGSAQVRLFGSSYGGQVCLSYLYGYAGDGDVKKIVLEFPALGGSSFVADLLLGEDFHINAGEFTRFLQSYMNTELELDPLLQCLNLDFLNWLVIPLLQYGVKPAAETWGSLWDLIPASEYDAAKAALLAPGGSYAWEPDGDKLHHEIMPNTGKILRDAQAGGIDVRIVAGTGRAHLLGDYGVNSDGLLDTAYTTGAKTEGFSQRGIDVSTAWLPENTWFVQGLFHGASYFDPYATDLLAALMTDPAVNTVDDDPAYPQFARSRQPSENIDARLEGGALIVDNVSQLYDMQVLSVRAPGLEFGRDAARVSPGESVRVPLTGSVAAGGFVPVTVCYVQYTEGVPVVKRKAIDLPA